MPAFSGLTAKVALGNTPAVVASVRNWNVDTSDGGPAGVASNSSGMTVRKNGARDFGGSFDVYGKTPLGFILPGNVYTFYGLTDTDEFKAGIIVDEVSIRCPIASSGYIESSVRFSAYGSSTDAGSDNTLYTFQNKTSMSDSTEVKMFGAVETGAKVHWNPLTSGAYVGDLEIPDIESWELTLRCENKARVTSSTGGVTKRRAGPKDASARITLLESDLSALAAATRMFREGQMGRLDLYVDTSTFFLMEYMKLASLSVASSPESGEYDRLNVGFDFSGYAIEAGVHVKGQIVDPGAVAWW